MKIKSIAKSAFFKFCSVVLVAESLYLLMTERPTLLVVAEVVGCLGLSVGSFVYSFDDGSNIHPEKKLLGELNTNDYGTTVDL
jgi:hypothetical protein